MCETREVWMSSGTSKGRVCVCVCVSFYLTVHFPELLCIVGQVLALWHRSADCAACPCYRT